jgi:YidC/Oxa1 family membrane protein insertase
MLLQMPVFIALFGTLSYAIELRGASFLLWIKDLSEPDTLFRIGGFSVNLLPILMAATTIIQSKLSPTTPAGSDHAKMMTYFMPLFMMFIFWNFPSGLVLYWLMMNVFTICQQLLTQGIKK